MTGMFGPDGAYFLSTYNTTGPQLDLKGLEWIVVSGFTRLARLAIGHRQVFGDHARLPTSAVADQTHAPSDASTSAAATDARRWKTDG